VAGVAGFPELEAGELAAIAGTLGAAFSGGASLLPNGGNPVQTAYNQLQEQLTNAFSQTTIANGNNQFFITGGTTRGSYVPADWGLLYAVGQLIFSTIWSWPPASETGRLLKAMQQSYAVTVWQALLAASPWYLWWNDSGNGEPPSDFPEQYIFVSYSLPEWITVSSWITYEYPPLSTLAALFDPKTYGAVFPLGVPLSDVYQGNYGWPHLTLSGANLQSPAPQPMPPVPGADLRLTPTLTRDPVTGEVVAAITLLNRGLTAATNVEITDARLPGKHPLSALPTRHTRLATGKTETCLVRFPNLTAGQRVVLHLSGKYLGGTFGDSFHVTVP
jgi:hypothetical protein